MKKYFHLLVACILIIASCRKDDDSEPKSAIKQITSFVLEKNKSKGLDTAKVTFDKAKKTITIEVPFGTNVTKLNPIIKISKGATISPKGAQDFTKPVTYTVTAADKSTAKYVATVVIGKKTEVDEKTSLNIISMLSFMAAKNVAMSKDVVGKINAVKKTILVSVPYGTDVTKLEPTIVLSKDSKISPIGVQNYTKAVTYTLTAKDKSVSKYVVTVVVKEPTDREVLISLYKSNPGNTLGWDIEYKDISTWKGVKVTTSGRVYELNLFDKELTTLPSIISKLTELQELNLGFNKLTGLPKEIVALKRLTHLNMSTNKLGNVPKEILKLSKLIDLSLDYNGLSSIPKELGNLVNLIDLDLGWNKITSFPKELGKLTKLTSLNLLGNKITSLPKEICELHKKYNTTIDSYILDLCEN